tara:strand:+ start:323 stop:610 length:288 start_codon:yes stop_codon:yes gene_type:complete
MRIFRKPIQFEWDAGNNGKNLQKHGVTDEECEEVFYDRDKKIMKDVYHSKVESRFILIGQTKTQRLLFLVFAMRGKKIRVVSARDLNNKEKKLYK